MALEIIGAGMGRTGTHSLKLALQQLGFGKCYHMEDLIGHHPENLHSWKDMQAGKRVNWAELFKGYRSAVDFPDQFYYKEFMRHYPEAKIILTVRDPESWYKSFGDTIIWQSNPSLLNKIKTGFRMPFDKKLRQRMKVVMFANSHLKKMFNGRFLEDKEMAIKVLNDWNEEVKATVSHDRLLVCEIKQGWRPICDFLGVPVPDKPFPRSNTTAQFNAQNL